MKNRFLIFLSVAILFLQSSFVCAETLVSWQEICPTQYQNVKYHRQFYKTQITMGVLLCASLYGLGIGIPMIALAEQRKVNNYWALRKKEYEKAVATCESSENKTMCYMQIREDEFSKNQEHSLSSTKSEKFDSSKYY